ncbi:MAG: site-specific DNA-methyltransferase [Nitrospira defluvii]|nr:site-specific DNA-methyltransferase [Nitrospira defluvii]
MAKKTKPAAKTNQTAPYKHPEAKSLMRPEVGTQAQFKKKKLPKTYRYDSSLAPALDWDATNPAREQGETLIKQVLDAKSLEEAKTAASKLKSLSKPFLNWAGKAERLSFDVPTLPLFIHERLSTKAIIETLAGHKTDKQEDMFALFGDPQHSITDQVLKAYEYQDNWTNRMVLGDSLVVMNSLLHYEGLGGQVQMIYMDPPYGVKFGSNFQPFVRKRDVSHNDDEDMTREPEMVQAYRDTWELGLHSYLTYLRDRLLLARDLLTPSGSIFVQISDENLHHVREVMDEVFGAENFVVIVAYRRLGMMIGETITSSAHYLIWYARDKDRMKLRKVFERQIAGVGSGDHYTQLENTKTAETRVMTAEEKANANLIPESWKAFQLVSLATGGYRPNTTINYEFEKRVYHPGPNKCWRTTKEGLDRLASEHRIMKAGNTLRYKQFLEDFPLTEMTTIWDDTARDPENFYVVQTPSNVIQRCLLMTTDPGDLVLDPTCGSGTTAYVAEQWGRRWITADTSRVPLALARQRLLTATFPWYDLKDNNRGPAGGFTYKRKQNKKGEEVGGIVPHVTLKSIANNEPPAEEVLVDRPEQQNGITRVTGPFCFEATIPTPVDWEGDGIEDSGAISAEAYGSFVDRMLEVLRKSPVLRLEGNKTVTLKNIRPPAKTLSLSAEALIANGQEKPAAFVFGPENGAVSEKLVYEAAREAHAKKYTHLYVVGFAIQPNARTLVEKCADVMGVPATYVQATPDLMMGDLLKNMRSSQIFSVCGQPEIKVMRNKEKQYQVELLGLDVFDPITMEVTHRSGADVPAWFLDTDYNDLCFHVSQAFFPRTSAWDNLKKALKGEYEESVWDHLSGTTSAPFEAGEHKQIAVKVIDDRGNELLVVRKL